MQIHCIILWFRFKKVFLFFEIHYNPYFAVVRPDCQFNIVVQIAKILSIYYRYKESVICHIRFPVALAIDIKNVCILLDLHFSNVYLMFIVKEIIQVSNNIPFTATVSLYRILCTQFMPFLKENLVQLTFECTTF